MRQETEKKGMFHSTLKLCELWHAALFCYHLSQWLLNNKCQSPFVQLGNCTFIWRLYCNTEIVFHLLGVGITKRTWWGFQSLGLQNQRLNWSILFFLFSYEKSVLELPAQTQMVFPGKSAHTVPHRSGKLCCMPKSAGKVLPTKSTIVDFSFCIDLLRC